MSELVKEHRFMADINHSIQSMMFDTFLLQFNALKENYYNLLSLYKNNNNKKSIDMIEKFIKVIENTIKDLEVFKNIKVNCYPLFKNYEDLNKVHQEIVIYLKEQIS